MANVIMRSELLQFKNKAWLLQGAKAERAAAKFSATAGPTVFLSHSHYDTELVESAVALLKSVGADAYIDWLDADVPSVCSSATATIIRGKIVECKKFIMLASEKALDSAWVPWELGCADGIRGTNDLAVLPIRNSYGEYKGNEYVGMYASIRSESSGYVVVPSGRTVGRSLAHWLSH